MLGAICGDIIGSVFEWHNIKSKRFPLFDECNYFTDDTLLTVAVADCLLNGLDYADQFRKYYKFYPNAGYGNRFHHWARLNRTELNNSFGNGSAMRVSPVAYAYDNLEAVLAEAKKSALPTHGHPEGVKGAQAVASAVFLARQGNSKKLIKKYITDHFGYCLDDTVKNLQKTYGWDETCPGSVPQAIIAFLEARDFEDAIRNAVSIGGDSDTIACITGSIAEAYYRGVPEDIKNRALPLLDRRLSKVVFEFRAKYHKGKKA